MGRNPKVTAQSDDSIFLCPRQFKVGPEGTHHVALHCVQRALLKKKSAPFGFLSLHSGHRSRKSTQAPTVPGATLRLCASACDKTESPQRSTEASCTPGQKPSKNLRPYSPGLRRIILLRDSPTRLFLHRRCSAIGTLQGQHPAGIFRRQRADFLQGLYLVLR